MKKKIIMHILLKKKHVLLCWEKNKIKRKLIFLESLIFFFFFLFFLILQKFDTLNVRLYLPTERTFFNRNLHHPIPGRLSLLIPKNISHNFTEKYAKISPFPATIICLWRTLTSLCTVIPRSSLRRLFFVIIINSALMPPGLVENSKKK